MKYPLLIILALSVSIFSLSRPVWALTDPCDGQYQYYTIILPADFITTVAPVPCEPVSSALVTSPDKKVSFYFSFASTQKDLRADYQKLQKGEKQISRKITRKSITDPYGNPVNQVETYVTIAWAGNGYKRSYYRKDMIWENTREITVFGYTYPDDASYKKYLPKYLDFKKSLTVNYAD